MKDTQKEERAYASGGESRKDIIEGINAVFEALRSSAPLEKIYISKTAKSKLGHILAIAGEKNVPVVSCEPKKLDAMSVRKSHQGVIAVTAASEYLELDELIELFKHSGEPAFLIACDSVSDPQNLGAIIRTAECAGADGLIIPKRRSAGLTAIVNKTSAGAASHFPVARVTNLGVALEELKANGVWIYGADMAGEKSHWETDFKGPLCLVIGSEGKGISRLLREKCDFLVNIPMRGKINSLNAAVAAAVLIYEVRRQRDILD